TMNNLAHFIGVPKGHHENSPAFQRRGKVRMPQVPKGRLEDLNARGSEQPEPQPSLRDSRPFGVQPSVELKRWAILACPFGTAKPLEKGERSHKGGTNLL